MVRNTILNPEGILWSLPGFWFCPSCRASDQDKSTMKPRAQFLLDLEQHHRERKGNTFTLQVRQSPLVVICT